MIKGRLGVWAPATEHDREMMKARGIVDREEERGTVGLDSGLTETSPNFIAIQINCKLPCTFDVVFQSAAAVMQDNKRAGE